MRACWEDTGFHRGARVHEPVPHWGSTPPAFAPALLPAPRSLTPRGAGAGERLHTSDVRRGGASHPVPWTSPSA